MRSPTPTRRRAASALLLALLTACGDDPSPADAGTTDAADTTTGDTDGSGDDAADDAADASSDADAPDATDEPDGTDASDDLTDDTGDDRADGSGGDDIAADAPTDAPPPRTLDPSPPWHNPPACGTGGASPPTMVPSPGQDGFDADLAAKARQYDRVFHAISAYGVDVNADIAVRRDDDARGAIERFAREHDGWDFEAATGVTATDVVERFEKVAGAYAGVGIAADAFRYAWLRDTGADCDEVAIAADHVRANLDAMHLATAITGVEGVIARGFARRDLPGGDNATTPLFDEGGAALPYEKNNGTWREDNSGDYPNYVWEDSCSRDMLIGWVIGMAATWEAVRLDPAFDDALKSRLKSDAFAILRTLQTVQVSGFDLEIQDADGRPTFHAYLHESAIDRTYVPRSRNGQHAIMAAGIVAGLAFIAEEPSVDTWLYDELVERRGLVEIAATAMPIDAGLQSNYSNYNMAFQGTWLASRYLRDPAARRRVADVAGPALYNRAGRPRQPIEQGQTFYDFVYAAATLGDSAFGPPSGTLDADAVESGLATLRGFPVPPYWDVPVENCDEAEIAAGVCVGIDGTEFEVLGYVGRNDDLVTGGPIPFAIRPPSNYTWRSNPYKPNGGGDGSRLLPGVDFRFAYWLGRHTRR